MKYRALTTIEYPTDPAIITRLRAGENLRFRDRKVKRLKPGDIADDIPARSIPGLLRRGEIEAVKDNDDG